MIRRPKGPVSLIPHRESLHFWMGEDLQESSGGVMMLLPCLYSGFVEVDNDNVAAMIDAAFASREEAKEEEDFALNNAEEFAQLDHEHCAICRYVLTREHGRPMLLRIIIVACPSAQKWGVFINHASACWACWRSLRASNDDNHGEERLWMADVDDSHLQYIEAYARKHLGRPPSDPSELRAIVVDMVRSMNINRCGDALLRKSVQPCPLILWDYRRLLAMEKLK